MVYAGTGSGKTSILDGISWCLYGKELHKQPGKKDKRDSLLNEKKLDELDKSQTADVSIEILLGESEDNIDIQLLRRITFLKDNEGNPILMPNSEEFKAKIKDARDNFIDADPEVVANWVFPEDIQHLFMFDGEKLERFFEEDNVANTKQAIHNVTQIDHLSIAIANLKKVSKSYVTKNDDENPEVEKLNAYIDGLEKRVASNEIDLQGVNISLDEARRKYAQLEELLENSKNTDVKKLVIEQREFEKKILSIEKKIDETKTEKFVHLISSVPVLFCKDVLNDAHNKIDAKYESGELPPDIKAEFIDKLLEKEICVCNTPLKDGSEARKALEKYRDKAPLSKYESEIRHCQSEIRTIITAADQFTEKRRGFYVSLDEYGEQLDYFRLKFEEIERTLDGIDIEEIEQIRSEKEFLFSEIQKFNANKGRLDEEIDRDRELIKAYEAKKRRVEKELIKNKEMRLKFEICDKAINFLQEAEENLLTELKGDIEERTDEIFRTSVIEPRVERVKISESFECQVLGSNGKNIYGSLSSGQKQGLATSFMIALRRDSGFDSPILMDYPFGRLDVRSTSEFINALKHILSDVQVIFFLIEGKEFSGVTEKQMEDRLGSLYEIKKVASEKRSEVIQHA